MRKVLIGEGGSGRVYRIWWEKGGQFTAEKVSRSSLAWEGLWLKRLQAFSVPRIYEVQNVSGIWRIRMEYLPGKNLNQLLEDGVTEEDKLLFVVKNVIEEVEKIHEKYPSYALCDLKPSNIMVGVSQKITLIDFGSVAEIGKKKTCYGTKPYTAPEVVEIGPSKKSDIYSIAQIIWQIRGWKKDIFYYRVIAPCLRKNVEKRKGDLGWLKGKIEKKLLWKKRKERAIEAAAVLWKIVVMIVIGLGVWYLYGKKIYDFKRAFHFLSIFF